MQQCLLLHRRPILYLHNDITARKKGSVLALSVTFLFLFFFVCHSNILGTAERVCAKFTGKMCLVPCSDEFECQGQRSKVKVTMDKKTTFFGPFGGLRAVYVW